MHFLIQKYYYTNCVVECLMTTLLLLHSYAKGLHSIQSLVSHHKRREIIVSLFQTLRLAQTLTADLLHHSALTLFHEQLMLQRCSHKASIKTFSSNATVVQIASSVLSAFRQWFLLTHNLYMIKMPLNSCQRLFVCKLLWTDSLQMISS